jgi:hypothetical protein
MKKFILKILFFYIVIISLLFPIKLIKELPNIKLKKVGLEKNQIKWITFNNQKSCDVLFLGSSKIYCSINPVVFSSITHFSSYNLGTGSQSIAESFVYLKQANRRKKIRFVVLDLFANSFNSVDFMHMRKNANYLDYDLSGELFLKTGFSKNVFCCLIPSLEDANYLKDFFWFTKEEGAINQHNPWDHGFMHSKSQAISASPRLQSKSLEKLDIENLDILDNIVCYCQINNIKLILTNLPHGLNSIQSKMETDFFHHYCKKYTHGVFFSSYPNLLPREVQADAFHLNDWGAELCTKRLAYFFNDLFVLRNDANTSGNNN